MGEHFRGKFWRLISGRAGCGVSLAIRMIGNRSTPHGNAFRDVSNCPNLPPVWNLAKLEALEAVGEPGFPQRHGQTGTAVSRASGPIAL